MKKPETIILLSLLTALVITSCSDNTTKRETTNNKPSQKAAVTKTSKILSKPKHIPRTRVSPVALAADMKTVEELLNDWSSGYDSGNKQYSKDTYRMLMLARVLLTNTHMLPEHKIKIMDKYNKDILLQRSLRECVRTNEQRIADLIRHNLYWPYPTSGALFLVLNNIVNDNNANEYTKAQAYIRLAQINHYFYRHGDEALFYLRALNTYPDKMEEDKLLALNKIAGAQNNIWDEHERISIVKQAVDGIDDTYDKSRFRIALCEAYTRCAKYDDAQEVFDEITQNATANDDEQLHNIEKHILGKNPIFREKETWCYIGRSINEIPNIRIDWEALDTDSFKQYFRSLLDALINAEQSK